MREPSRPAYLQPNNLADIFSARDPVLPVCWDLQLSIRRRCAELLKEGGICRVLGPCPSALPTTLTVSKTPNGPLSGQTSVDLHEPITDVW